MRKLLVVSAGLSVPSTTTQIAQRIGSAVKGAVSARGESLEVDTIELRELAQDLAQFMVNGQISTPKLDQALQAVEQADALVAVSPIFKASYNGLFKMFFDAIDKDALIDTPVIIAATAGTARHSLALEHALRPLFAYLRAVVMPTSLFAATEDFGNSEGAVFEKRILRAAGELADHIVATEGHVGGLGGFTADPAPKGDADVTPFAQMLSGHDGRG
ncbi:FMN reductase [Corynebacterium kozikiae]|uniref:FMN reductase n=1 Tax=Corynebacterium kozikiae TaxID=2968469 RepID=UPI00211B8577|nr:FMN reductase [Corynebacterium sp. 76QC2CO]MCQ9342456.1 FMN reductase [Corynebacterium sp. 76QC2CO]